MAKRGGKRANAGRKKGDYVPLVDFRSYWTDEEKESFFEYLKKRARKSDKIAIFVGEHLLGKAPQPVTGEQGGPVEITVVKYAK